MRDCVPKRLYKYRSLYGESRDRTIDAIRKTEAYFSRPSQFNDPHDCNLTIDGLSDSERSEIDSELDRTGIFCLSEVNNDTLMWSHYADSHRGVCIEYATSDDLLFGCELIRVRYATKYPALSSSDTPDRKYIRKYLSTKSNRWKHEREWRIIHHDPGLKDIPPENEANDLAAVILGCKISNEDRDEIVRAVQSRADGTLTFQVSLVDTSYDLRVEPIES